MAAHILEVVADGAMSAEMAIEKWPLPRQFDEATSGHLVEIAKSAFELLQRLKEMSGANEPEREEAVSSLRSLAWQLKV